MTDRCIFCRIAEGSLPAHKLYEDDRVLAFLDLHPVRAGHALVIPRAHHEGFEDMDPDTAAAVMAVAQRLARRMKAVCGVDRVGMAFVGIHVPHAHAHLIPLHHRHDLTSAAYLRDGIDGFTAPPPPPAGELARMAGLLREGLE
ncbi:HIT family protein [Ruixingdingia sedimenti]|uniref:HIT domain-containing protein n=1 Tax=Ruixingdingia sedimenti TaxID=3073604 RepID=A0ABU1F3N9_9RHOB|nr:HIT domain-containing protein [Xinfangfangia sp. LG-4]MDR5651481.1 HIT domain-containing protein [Xinfangfangia sp. LG-4]